MKTKKFNYLDIIIIILLIGIAVGTAFHMSSHQLFIKSAKELIDSGIYYGKSLISFEETIPNDGVSFLKFDEEVIRSTLPIVPEEFGFKFLGVFECLVNKDYFIIAWNSFCHFVNKLTFYVLLLGVPVIILYWLYYSSVLFASNDKPQTKQSKPLKAFLWLKSKAGEPTASFLKQLWNKFRHHKYYFWPFMLMLIYNVNGISLILIALAFYLYFVMSLDFLALYYLICKVFICLSPLLLPIFWPFWIILIIALIIRFKIKLGYRKLDDLYDKNNDYVKSLGIVTGIYGPPGCGKNQLEVAMVTQIEWNLRQQAADDMMEIRLEFPNFPFRLLEEHVENLKNSNTCVNKVQIKFKIADLYDRNNLFGYDLKNNKTEHYDQLKVRSLKDELIDYAELYFIYISSLACSTYSIRFDKGLFMDGHYPSLIYDFFHRDLRDESLNERAKIFDLNQLRLLKQKENDAIKDPRCVEATSLFDAGAITLSEFGKDRGNRYSNQSRQDYDTKPSNDGTAACFGVFRHLTTVRNKPYGYILWDEQKISAFSNAEAAMAEQNIYLGTQQNKMKNAVPGFFIESTLISWGKEHFTGQMDRYVKTRNDQTLYSYFYLRIAGIFSNLVRRLNNIFGYRKLDLKLSGANINGSQEQRGEQTFYLMNKIVFADRYQTDCYSGFFETLKLQSRKGINQLKPFSGRVATPDELGLTNGYFASELMQSIETYVLANIDLLASKELADEKDAALKIVEKYKKDANKKMLKLIEETVKSIEAIVDLKEGIANIKKIIDEFKNKAEKIISK